jgi:peptide/nickel transport system substrate-binding protein
MTRSLLKTLLALAALVALLGLGACGGDDEESGDTGGTPAQTEEGGGTVTDQLFAGSAVDNRANPTEGGKKGGKFTILSAGDTDYMDPGKTYYSYGIGIQTAINRGLYGYLPQDSTKAVPDLADGDPEISEDGKTVTVKIKPGATFSKPVGREITSKDFKYAIERAFTSNVSNGYAAIYMRDLIGAPKEPGKYKEISGIETPDDQTIVFKLSKGTGAALAGALAMPISVPVPKEFAQKYDKENPSTYGEQYAVYTGPYMVESDADGKAVGFVAGKSIHLVRNPDYKNVDDFRPAYFDEIELLAGNEDNAVATRRILSGESMGTGDIEPPASQLKRLLESNKSELSAVPANSWRMIALNTQLPPFDDINVRKAVIAGFNRSAARQQRGGEALGPIAQHYIVPGMAGFEESNGVEGWTSEQDWMAHPEGDRNLSAEYFKKAGMASGKYEGDAEVLLVGDGAEPDKSVSQITEQQLNEMGFKTKLRLVERSTMFTKFCGVPKENVNVCPSVGWIEDFSDPQTMIDPIFNGANILQVGNNNWPQLDVPEVNDAINKAALVTDPAARAQAWADANKLVTEQAPAIPYMWDYQSIVASPNVRGVQNGYSTIWDLNFSSLR